VRSSLPINRFLVGQLRRLSAEKTEFLEAPRKVDVTDVMRGNGFYVVRFLEGKEPVLKECDKEAVHIGDRLRVGSAEFVVTQPRMPCFKLGIRFGRPEIVKRFLQSGRSGFYLAVLEEGRVTAGDSVEWLTSDERSVTVADIVNLYKADETN